MSKPFCLAISRWLGCGRTVNKQMEHPGCSVAFGRFLMANKKRLSGLGFERTTRSIDDFLHHFRFRDLVEAAEETNQMTGLICAVLSGDCRMIRILVEAKASVEMKSEGLSKLGHVDGLTPLLIATRSKQDGEVLSALLELQADVHAVDPKGFNAASLVQTGAQVKALLAARADFHTPRGSLNVAPLSIATAFADAETVQELLKLDCEVNPKACASPLHYPATWSVESSVEKAKLLISHKANLNAKMASWGQFGCVCSCMRLSANIWGLESCSAAGKLFASWDGMTPLSVAAFYGDQALVCCLLEAGQKLQV